MWEVIYYHLKIDCDKLEMYTININPKATTDKTKRADKPTKIK